jgi:PPK2 family polyphosphate:nucleotide phosphotransferase
MAGAWFPQCGLRPLKENEYRMAKTSLTELFRVKPGSRVRMRDHDPAWTGKYQSKEQVEELMAHNLERLRQAQDLLFATSERAVLVVLQAMDTAGKDGLIEHVMTGLNPAGCQVFASKEPTAEELSHDFLWRYYKRLPARGNIGIFNRSYYEEVLVVRVHPKVLESQRLPPSLVTKEIWDERFEDIRSFERHMARSGTVIRKFFLHLSKKEQKRRFLARLDEPQKNWKFSAADIHEREYWDDYQKAYEEMIRNTSTKHAPWYVIPADNKWFTHLAVSAAIVETLEELGLAYPKVDAAQLKELQAARKTLEKK